MKFFDFIESKFIASHIEMSKNQDSKGLAKNQAIRILMWAGVTLVTAYHVLRLTGNYAGVLVGIIERPKLAKDVAADALDAVNQEKLKNKKAAQDIIQGAIDATKIN